jgi:hypothetical protein
MIELGIASRFANYIRWKKGSDQDENDPRSSQQLAGKTQNFVHKYLS